jgi:PrtD family type I secretion system ABC transporter
VTKVHDTARQALRHGRWILAVAFAMSFAVNLLRLAGPLFIILIYDRVLPSRSQETLVALFALLVTLVAVQGILDYARRRVLARFGAQFQERLEAVIFATTSQAEMFDPSRSKPTAGLDELDGLRAFFHSSSIVSLFDFVWTPMFLGFVFVLHPLLGWVCLGGIAILFVFSLLQMALMGDRLQDSVAASRGIGDLKNMIVASRDVVRGQEMATGFKARWLEARRQSRDRAIALKDWTVGFDNLSSTTCLIVRYSVLAVGAWLTLSGALTIGAMVAATFLVNRVLSPVDHFMGELPNIVEATRNWGRLKRFLSDRPDPDVAAGLAGNPRIRLDIDAVSVKSPLTGAMILKGLSLQIPPGSMVQVTGASGRGKSVLAQTVLGLWRRSAGAILIDGLHLESIPDRDRARIFGYVPETVGFVSGTLAENIAHLDPDASPERVAAAAKQACLHAFISSLPEGYRTRIDPTASALSRGQRHQLALARAVYGDPLLLIIDEPDAMLLEVLPETMDKTFGAILRRGGSVLMLARKPLELKHISATYRLEDGKLKVVKQSQPVSGPKLAVLPERAKPDSAKPDARKPDDKPNPMSLARR